ncbi:MAG: cytochrome c [Saprospiraceae bacterium]|nr:c-type cytochrome [Lewinella sp.]
MEKDNFESGIKSLVGSYERQPPEGQWERIRNHLPPPGQSTSINPLILSFIIVSTLLIGALFFYYGVGKPPAPDVFDNYWMALKTAQRENKPMLVLFTQNCEDCEVIDKALRIPQVADLANDFVQVRLRVDDLSPIDDGSDAVPFDGWDDVLLEEIGGFPCPEQRLSTQGEVWQLLQDYLIGEAASPVLAVIDLQNRATPFQWYDKVTDSKRLRSALHVFLKGELEYFNRDLQKGKSMFVANCAACHNRNMKDDMTGPALGGVRSRWQDYPPEDLYNYIRNSQKMIAEGHPKAVEDWNRWKPTIMTSFPSLSDQELGQLLDYVEWQYRHNEY